MKKIFCFLTVLAFLISSLNVSSKDKKKFPVLTKPTENSKSYSQNKIKWNNLKSLTIRNLTKLPENRLKENKGFKKSFLFTPSKITKKNEFEGITKFNNIDPEIAKKWKDLNSK